MLAFIPFSHYLRLLKIVAYLAQRYPHTYIMKKLTAVLFAALMLTSCVPTRKIIYLQGSEDLVNQPQRIADNYIVRIKPSDRLYINVSGYNDEQVKHYQNVAQLGSVQSGGNQNSGFVVSDNGTINIPLIGELNVAGKTTSEIEKMVAARIIALGDMEEPTVNVTLANFRVSVMGEVKSPGVVEADGQRLTLLEALSRAGDLPATARRDSILVVRENGGIRSAYYVDLTQSEDVFKSPAYYLQQNDVVYVKPNNSVRVQGSSTLSTIGAISSVIGVVSGVLALILVFTK